MCSIQLILLGHVAPGPLAINVTAVLAMPFPLPFLETQGLPFRELAVTTSQDLLFGTECEPIT